MALVCFESRCGAPIPSVCMPIDAYNRNQAVILGNSMSQVLELKFHDLEGRIGQFHCSASYIWKKNSQSLIWNPNPEGQSKGLKRPHKRPSLSESSNSSLRFRQAENLWFSPEESWGACAGQVLAKINRCKEGRWWAKPYSHCVSQLSLFLQLQPLK